MRYFFVDNFRRIIQSNGLSINKFMCYWEIAGNRFIVVSKIQLLGFLNLCLQTSSNCFLIVSKAEFSERKSSLHLNFLLTLTTP